MLVDDRLDFTGVNILAASDNHVLQAIQNVEIAVSISIADIAGAKQAVSKGERIRLRIVPVPAHNVRASHHQFTGMTGFDFFSRFIHNPHINPWTSSSTGQQFLPRVLLVLETSEKT